MRQVTGWIGTVTSDVVVCCVCLVGVVHAGQPDTLNEPVDWDVLPNGLIEVRYDRSGDGIPDHVALHQITWSGWSAQPMAEIEAQARADGERIFLVEYDNDRYVYLTRPEPLFVGEDARQDGSWVAVLAAPHGETVRPGCPGCAQRGGGCNHERC